MEKEPSSLTPGIFKDEGRSGLEIAWRFEVRGKVGIGIEYQLPKLIQ